MSRERLTERAGAIGKRGGDRSRLHVKFERDAFSAFFYKLVRRYELSTMTPPDRDLDVAVSFANEDLALATAIRDGLADSLNVFVYTAKQEELAGTDGLESFRQIFRWRARLVVILFRSKWGKTPWTRVEEEAITDRFLKEGPGFLFVIVTEEGATLPPWLPDKLLRFSLKDFPLEQALGAIKARSLDQGSVLSKPSVAALAARAQERATFERRRAGLLNSEQGVQQARQQVQVLIEAIAHRVAEVQASAPGLQIEYGAADVWFVIRTHDVAVDCSYRNPIVNSLSEARLVIRELRGGMLLPGQRGYYFHEPREVAETVLRPDVALVGSWGWRGGGNAMQSSGNVADFCVARILALIEAHATGQLPSVW